MATDPAAELTRLRTELDDVTRREAAFRLKTAKDYLKTEATLRDLEQRINQLNTYVHERHVERDTLRRQIQAAHADLEVFTWKLRALERDAEALAALKKSFVWPLISGFAKVPRRPDRSASIPPAEFTYYLHTSPYRLYRPGEFLLRGWALPKDGRALTAIRVALDDKTFHGITEIEEAEVVVQNGALAAKNPKPGFEVKFMLDAGRHDFSLEAQIDHQNWYSILVAPIWCEG